MLRVLAQVLEDFNESDAKVELIYVNEKYIRNLNRKFFGRIGPTDVISFPFGEESFLGEIYVSVDTVEKQAKEYETTFEDEIIRVSVHGLLHLLGFEDKTDEGKNKMQALEDKYLSLA